ncbi:ankyrin repeat domain-containing protein [Diaphorobacter sp.]|uniref:ankyrin repeat domain-containing protein n=1 Tax=Diaphorobacter sp. TaxID=1934310 RepID=UPI0028AFDEAC|nr:ankyrin repeat domain-containing protein [Diaphorobacter sp.]
MGKELQLEVDSTSEKNHFFPARRQWCKALLAFGPLVVGWNAHGKGPFAKTTHPEQYFDGRMLEIAQAIQSNDMLRLRQLAAGQNLDQPGRQDMTLLWFAIQPDQLNMEAVKTLVSLGADPAAQPIRDFGSPFDVVFTSRKNPEDTLGLRLLQAMLDGGLSPNHTAGGSMTLLQKAARSGNEFALDMVKLLLQRGANINARDRIGGSALYDAMTAANPHIAPYLVQHGAKVDTYTVNGVTVGWSVKMRLERFQPGPLRTQFEQLRDLLVSRGMKWPPDSPEVVREQMRERGERVVVPAGKKR